ncbi:MAG TPA: type II secretion system major pseudopilin GspG [Caulobacteraceae bacterium]|nr:type II secretion system major pseudopilin GspG [Caulobacteraceae bacterium]
MRRSPSGRPDLPVKGEAGYTLTEMLVVIGIIGLIAAVLTPGLMGQMGRARSKAAQLQLETLSTAVEIFQADVGRYPSEAEGLRALASDPGLEGWTGPYARDSRLLKDPWGNEVRYALRDEGRGYRLESLGADGAVGGKGAARDLKAPAE